MDMLLEEDETRAFLELRDCIGNLGNDTINEENDLIMSHCISVKLGIVDNVTGKVDKPRLKELVMKSDIPITEQEKKDFVEGFAKCGDWQCFNEHCHWTSTIQDSKLIATQPIFFSKTIGAIFHTI